MEPSRATDTAGIRERMLRFSTSEGWQRGLAYVPSPSDVFIATYPKCGTTLMQQIVHGLRTCGDMDFDEITEVVPWVELAHDLGMSLEAPQRAEPKVFKTHLDWHQVSKGGRYIYVVRDPRDVLVSFFHFFEGWVFETGSIQLERFALDYVLAGSGSGRYWDHLVSWWPKRNDADTLWLCFEDVVADLSATVERVARFLDTPLDPERLATACRQASIEFMRAHERQFDDHLVRAARNAACGLPAEATTTKVRKGSVGEHRSRLTPAVVAAWDERWRQVVEPATGLASYDDLRRSFG